MSTAQVAAAWFGLFVGLVVLVVALALLHRVLRPLLEIRRYADDILEAGVGIAQNVDGVDEAVRTRELADAVPGLARSYLERLWERR